MAEEELVSDVTQFSVEVSAHSHLIFSNLKQFEEVIFWERPELPEIERDDFDVFINLSVHDRIDNLANIAYEDPDFMWALNLANGVGLPPLQMQPGFRYRFPAITRVKDAIRGK